MQCAISFRKKIYNYFSSINCLVVIFIATLTFILLASFYMKDASYKRSYPERLRDINDLDYIKLEKTKMMREISENVNELWFYIKTEMNKIKEGKIAAEMTERVGDYKNVILDNINVVDQVDSELRRKQINRLSEAVQKNLHHLQNPQNCESAKKVICRLIDCGLGCIVHHVTYCMFMAYGTNRTLVLGYGGRFGRRWKLWFEPISSCSYNSSLPVTDWNDLDNPMDCKNLNLKLPYWGPMQNKPNFIMPQTIPHEISWILSRLHGYPFLWWAGQFISYLLRPTKELQKLIENAEKKLKLHHPTIGIHVRRSDKLKKEAKFHDLNEYMQHAEEYYQQLQIKQPNCTPRIYLASDDYKVFQQAKKRCGILQTVAALGTKLATMRRIDKIGLTDSVTIHYSYGFNWSQLLRYNICLASGSGSWNLMKPLTGYVCYPKYTFVGDIKVSQDAAPDKRSMNESLLGIILDVHFLYHSDFFVCTLSSNVGRLVYALMQTIHTDASSYVHSVDQLYYFHTTPVYDFEAIIPHVATNKSELNLTVGDIIVKSINIQWNGYFKGTNKRTNKTGIFPLFKVRDVVRNATFGNYSYPQVSPPHSNGMK